MEPFASLLGVETDAEVARRAGVSPETARIYRVKHGIPSASARNREWVAASEAERSGEPEAAAGGDALPPEYTGPSGKRRKSEKKAPEPETPEPQADASGVERPFRRGGQASPIDAHFQILGKVSDSEVARLAGVTTAAVSQYRRRRGIPSSVSGGRPDGGGRAEEDAPRASEPAAQAAPARSDERTGTRAIAWLVVIRRGEAEQSYIVVGSDVADAAARAVRRVEAGAEVISVTRHMDALV